MTIDAYTAAKTLGHLCKWEIPHLKMHKILYIAHTCYLGQYHEHLIDTPFQAWKYGPVQPKVYKRLSKFKRGAVDDVFYTQRVLPAGHEARKMLEDFAFLNEYPATQLVNFTHRRGAAWDLIYNGDRDVDIPDHLIIKEYSDLHSINALPLVSHGN